MNLRHTCTRSRPPLHQAFPFFPRKADPEHFLGASAPEIRPYHLLDILPLILRRIIEHPREHLLELRRQHRALHGNRLPNLEVQAAVGAEQLEEPLGAASVQVVYGPAEQRFWAEVELVVERDVKPVTEGEESAADAGAEHQLVGKIARAVERGEDDEAPEPFSAALVLPGRLGGAERRRRRGTEGFELARGLDVPAKGRLS